MNISIIIPCYNSGAYLTEALESIVQSHDIERLRYEVIIVDDGSADDATLTLLDQVANDTVKVLRKANGGPASARNMGVGASTAPYLLFLDSDNRVRPDFIRKGLAILSRSNADIVHSRAAFFGDATRDEFKTGPFDFTRMLWMNYIDICTIMRKSVHTAVGGFDEDKMLIGFEDWDFWIKAAAAGHRFHFADEVLFDYRIHAGSLLSKKNTFENFHAVVDHLYQKHAHTVATVFRNNYPEYMVYKKDTGLPFRSFFKFFYMKYIKPYYHDKSGTIKLT